MDSCTANLIKPASLCFLAQYNADDVERGLIEFFDHDTLLNRQIGGKLSAYVPSSADDHLFQAMETRFYQSYRRGARLPEDEMHEQLVAHFEHMQDFANSNPAITGTCRHKFTISDL